LKSVVGSSGELNTESRDLSLRKVIIPAGTVIRLDIDDRRVFVDMTNDEIEDSPEFDSVRGYDVEYGDRLGIYYGRSGWKA
jgi:hypothetical protein